MFRAGVLIVALIAGALLASPTRAGSPTNVVNIWDTDHDGTLDLNEINKAAEAEFAKLDSDHDGTLDMKELGHRVTKAEFLTADKDKDGTLDKAEYLSIVAERFHAANPDNDTTIETKELRTAAGHRLETLLR
jgi:Ca2+-binding EF-hand superfamily protein